MPRGQDRGFAQMARLRCRALEYPPGTRAGLCLAGSPDALWILKPVARGLRDTELFPTSSQLVWISTVTALIRAVAQWAQLRITA
jgi:hypothetical protein